MSKQHGLTKRTTKSGGYHYKLDEIDLLGDHCSMTERRADEATRDVADWLKCEFMQDHVGEVFEGTISSVTGFGFFVRLNDLFIDGLVHISTLDNDYYRFDPNGQRLIGENSGMLYRIGDKVTVRVEAVSLEEKTLDFTLISSERKPQRLGKTEKDRVKKSLRYSESLQKRLRKQANTDEKKRKEKKKKTKRNKNKKRK